MIDKTYLIVNHEIKPSSSINYQKMLDYYSREGQFAIEGLDRSISREDVELELRKELRTLEDMADYYSRQNQFKERNPELPFMEEERSGTCFSQDGLYDSSNLSKALIESKSHIIRSVVSVRRSDAIEMSLACKNDFQRLLRETWERQVQEWGIINKEDIRWRAFYHTDNPINLHCHVLTWDNSGRFGGEVIPHIPTARMDRGKELIYEHVNRTRIDEIGRERGYLREYLIRSIERECGREITTEQSNRLEQLRKSSGSTFHFSLKRQTEPALIEQAIKRINEARPDKRTLSYSRSNAQVRNETDKAVNILRQNSHDFNKAFERYETLVKNAAQLRGYTDLPIQENGKYINPAKAHYCKQMNDLNTRLGNAVLREANRELTRDNERERAREGQQIHQRNRQYRPRNTQNRASRTVSQAMPHQLHENIKSNIKQGHALIKQGRQKEVQAIARETARKLINEPMTAKFISKTAQEREPINRTEEGRVLTHKEIERQSFSQAEQRATERIEKEMQAPQSGHSISPLLESLINTIQGPSLQASTTSRGMHNHTHRSRDAFRHRERNLDEAFARGH